MTPRQTNKLAKLSTLAGDLYSRANEYNTTTWIPWPYHHQLCRPPRDARNVLRLREDKRWIKDDGKPGLAFSGQMDGFGTPYAWATMCKDFCFTAKPRCPFNMAMERTVKRFGAANGRDVQAQKARK